ncbi:hypothetical protein FGF1_07400 [Flavobacteriaceae bacterium GF1]
MYVETPIFNTQLVLHKNACDYVVDKFTFGVLTVQTGNGHEFQSRFNRYSKDFGREQRYIKGGPQPNEKVERLQLTDKKGFYQPLDHSDDMDLNKKIKI